MINNKNILTVAAGFPSPAENYIEEKLNLDKHLIKNKESTFFVRVSGDSMINVGIFDNDILVVDRSLIPVRQSIVIASIDGEIYSLKHTMGRGAVLIVHVDVAAENHWTDNDRRTRRHRISPIIKEIILLFII